MTLQIDVLVCLGETCDNCLQSYAELVVVIVKTTGIVKIRNELHRKITKCANNIVDNVINGIT